MEPLLLSPFRSLDTPSAAPHYEKYRIDTPTSHPDRSRWERRNPLSKNRVSKSASKKGARCGLKAYFHPKREREEGKSSVPSSESLGRFASGTLGFTWATILTSSLDCSFPRNRALPQPSQELIRKGLQRVQTLHCQVKRLVVGDSDGGEMVTVLRFFETGEFAKSFSSGVAWQKLHTTIATSFLTVQSWQVHVSDMSAQPRLTNTKRGTGLQELGPYTTPHTPEMPSEYREMPLFVPNSIKMIEKDRQIDCGRSYGKR